MPKVKSVIVFLVPPEHRVNGGIMSIFSLAKESKRFEDIHGSDVVVATFPGYKSYGKNSLFDNQETILSFEQVCKKFVSVERMMIHVPEYAVDKFIIGTKVYDEYLFGIKNLHINVLNQKITIMPNESVVFDLYHFTPNITQTIAHERYCNQQISDEFNMPVHLMSVFIDPAQYIKKNYAEKQRLIAYSPDDNTNKASVIRILDSLTNIETVEIRDLSYSEYKSIVSKALFVVTFGEGMDGYFIESAFSGTFPFAVYNDEFFPDGSFKKLPTVYTNYEEMIERISLDIRKFDNEALYGSAVQETADKLKSYYGFSSYLENLKNFYLGSYSFKPSDKVKINSYLRLVATGQVAERRSMAKIRQTSRAKERSQNKIIEKQKLELVQLNSSKIRLSKEISNIRDSVSWKITSPFRKISRMLNAVFN